MFNINMNSKPTMDSSSLFNQMAQTMGGSQAQMPQGYPQSQNQQMNQDYNQNSWGNQGYPQGQNQQMNQNSWGNQGQNQNSWGNQGQNQGYTQSQMNQPIGQPRQRPMATGVILRKGQKHALTANNPGLDFIDVGLGWDLMPGITYDLDVEAFMLNSQDKVVGDDWFVFYNQPSSPDGSVRLVVQSSNGAGDGDDEVISVQLSRVNPTVSKIMFIVTINDAKVYGYNFGNVQNAYVRIVNKQNGMELARFNLTDLSGNVCSMMVGELYRHNGEWKFNSVGMGTNDDLLGLCMRYGVNVQG